MSACSEVTLSTGPRPQTESHPGFDTSLYPGDAAMRAWRQDSPYEWVGYYLAAPCHRDASWMGRRSTLASQGWGFAVLYVGQQDWAAASTQVARAGDPTEAAQQQPTCSATLLTAARGAAEAQDAAAKTAAEGFAPGTVIFLDVERVAAVSAALETYVRAWVDGVLADGRFTPGIYGHVRNAGALRTIARAAYAARGRSDEAPFWVAGSAADFSLASRPWHSGVGFASVWQGRLDTTESWGGVTLTIDVNVSDDASPSQPAP